MNEFEIRQQGKVRVWLDALPEIGNGASRTEERTFASENGGGQYRNAAGIEIFQHLGPRFAYGLLGAEYTPLPGSVLTVQVAVSNEIGEILKGKLAGQGDIVHSGLLGEFAEGVFAGVATLSKSGILRSGVLHYAWAAHGEIGSSHNVFKRLSCAVLLLIATKRHDFSSDDISDLLEF